MCRGGNVIREAGLQHLWTRLLASETAANHSPPPTQDGLWTLHQLPAEVPPPSSFSKEKKSTQCNAVCVCQLCGTKEQPFCDNPDLQLKMPNALILPFPSISFSTAREKQLVSGRTERQQILKSLNITLLLLSLPWSSPPTLNTLLCCEGCFIKWLPLAEPLVGARAVWMGSPSGEVAGETCSQENIPRAPTGRWTCMFEPCIVSRHSTEKQRKTDDLILAITWREKSLSSYACPGPRHLTQTDYYGLGQASHANCKSALNSDLGLRKNMFWGENENTLHG